MYAGKLNAARRTFTQAQVVSEADRNTYATSIALLSLAEVHVRQGALHQAAQLYQQVLKEIERVPMYNGDMLIRRGLALVGLGRLSLEWNDLDQAQQYGLQGREIGEQLAHEDIRAASTVLLARSQYARGEIAPAQAELLELSASTGNPVLLREIQAYNAWIALQTGDLVAAQRWRDGLPQPRNGLLCLIEELEALVASRLLIAQGEAGTALELLEEWLPGAREHGRMRSVLEGEILLAAALARQGDLPRAHANLMAALALAQPEGYRRIFLDEGHPLARLLQSALSHIEDESLAIYARALLYEFAQEGARQAALLPASSDLVIEPLSEQEQRVLRLLAAGRTNPDIAGELVISINTVKTHVKNIYGKLGVNSREQARQAARQMNFR